MSPTVFIAIPFVVGVGLLATVSTAQPVIRGIGVPANYTGSYAGWVTADGERVFGTATMEDNSGVGAPMLWSLTDGLRVLPTPESVNGVYPLAMSDDGNRLFLESNWAPQENHIWRWEGPLDSGVWSELPGFDATNLLFSPAVTRSGNAIVATLQVGPGAFVPVRWTAESGQVPLAAVEDQTFTTCANRDGSVVIGHSYSATLRWTAASGWQPIPLESAVPDATPMVVSGDGHVVSGWYAYGGWGIWYFDDRTGKPATPIVFNSSGSLWPSSISGDGEVIVGGMTDETNKQSAVIYTHASGCLPVADYIELHGGDVSGWQLEWASGVSDDGRTIVGQGLHEYASGQTRQEGWVVHIPLCPADMGMAGGEWGPDGVLDNNDFIAFINRFFAGQIGADVGHAGGETGRDGVFDNNDFIVFIGLFFAGCD